MSNPPLNEVNDSSVQTVQDKVPLGLDEPAPILVWRHGSTITRSSSQKSMAVFTTEEAALEFIAYWGDWFTKPEPYRIPLEDAFKIARRRGLLKVRLYCDGVRVIEEYPL